MRPARHALAGFTLIEALVALAVACILLGVAVPAWSSALARMHSVDAQARMTATLADSTRHATVTSTEVVLCPTGAGTACQPGTDWTGGWIAFADLDGDRQRSDREPVVHRETALGGGVRLRSTRGRTRLVFQPDGRAAGSNVTFTLCDGRGPRAAIALVLANNGTFHAAKPGFAAAADCVYATPDA